MVAVKGPRLGEVGDLGDLGGADQEPPVLERHVGRDREDVWAERGAHHDRGGGRPVADEHHRVEAALRRDLADQPRLLEHAAVASITHMSPYTSPTSGRAASSACCARAFSRGQTSSASSSASSSPRAAATARLVAATRPAVGLADQPHAAGMALRERFDHGRRGVRGAVVDDDDLQPVGRIVLIQRALDRLAYEPLRVVGRDQCADQRNVRHNPVIARNGGRL